MVQSQHAHLLQLYRQRGLTSGSAARSCCSWLASRAPVVPIRSLLLLLFEPLQAVFVQESWYAALVAQLQKAPP